MVLTNVEMANVTKYRNNIGSTVIFSIHFGLDMNIILGRYTKQKIIENHYTRVTLCEGINMLRSC